MSELLKGWYVDSSPGSSVNSTKCGEKFVSSGIAGTSTITTPYNTDIGDRAMVTPGTHPTINTGTGPVNRAARAQQLGFVSNGTVLFDAYAMMYGLTVSPQASSSYSLSFWISPDGAAQGAILGSPQSTYFRYPAQDPTDTPIPFFGTQPYFANFLSIGPVIGSDTPENYAPGGSPHAWVLQCFTPMANAAPNSGSGGFDTEISYGCAGGPTPFNAPHAYCPDQNLESGTDGLFYHCMIGVHTVSGVPKITIYINDTPILSDVEMADTTGSFTTPAADYKFQFGGTLSSNADTYPAMRDNAVPDQVQGPNVIAGHNVWQIGGRMVDWIQNQGNGEIDAFPEGDGLLGAVTEVWIDEKTYIDWSNSANRAKFHTTDILGNVFVPTDLGAHGQTPTGTRPTMYYTGNPTKFTTNRVNGQVANVYKGTTNSLTLDSRIPGAL
jgi:hypothetical protein